MFPEDLIEPAPAEPAPLSRILRPPVSQARRQDQYADERPKQRLWVHVLLFTATLFTTTLVGAHMQHNFSHNLPFFDIERFVEIFTIGLRSPASFATGLPFSLTLLTILLAHEMGHYLTCLYYGVDASLPYFLPSPMPVTGTFGAFIRIRSAVCTKRILFDIGIAGPIAGFIFLIPALGVGLAFSKVLPGVNNQGSLQLSVPALQWLAAHFIFPGVPASDIYLHPVARAAWVGMFATAMNLLPVGQLDGGHIVFALMSRAQKWITNFFLLALLPMGKLWNVWWFWAVMLFFFARKHPPLYDETPIGASRIRLAVVALCIFFLCFSVVPINELAAP